ncbi:MAG: hypothetical protein AB9856_02710 [Cellulosilyticaceae bacterium]
MGNKKLIDFIFSAVALGASVSSLVLLILKQEASKDILTLMALGMVCISIVLIQEKK